MLEIEPQTSPTDDIWYTPSWTFDYMLKSLNDTIIKLYHPVLIFIFSFQKNTNTQYKY